MSLYTCISEILLHQEIARVHEIYEQSIDATEQNVRYKHDGYLGNIKTSYKVILIHIDVF